MTIEKRTVELSRFNTVLNPYFHNKKQFFELQSEYIVREQQWRIIAFILSACMLIAILGIIYIGSKNKMIPYVVEVNQEGKILTVKGVKTFKGENSKIVANSLLRFIENFRTVSSDPHLQKRAVYELYAHLTSGAALEKMNTYFKENSPHQKMKDMSVYVKVLSVLPLSKDSWEIEWMESVRSKSTKYNSSSLKYRAILNVIISPPKFKNLKKQDELEASLYNPIGLYVVDINWTQQTELKQ